MIRLGGYRCSMQGGLCVSKFPSKSALSSLIIELVIALQEVTLLIRVGLDHQSSGYQISMLSNCTLVSAVWQQ